MFVGGSFFWYLMGIIFILVALGFKAYADEKGWILNWWKSLLAFLWYGLFSLSLLSWGTLIGENESTAGWKLGVLGLFITLILGVGLWRLLSTNTKVA